MSVTGPDGQPIKVSPIDKSPIPFGTPANEESRRVHLYDDVDYDQRSHHHTLGSGPMQAAPGTIIVAGMMFPYLGIVAPDGYVMADGGAVSRVTYAALFKLIGTAYGIGDGLTTFNTPNLKGRAIVGLDAGQVEFATMGQVGGAKTHTLTIAEMPSHQHSSNRQIGFAQGNGAFHASEWTSNSGRTDPWSVDATGGGGAHNNLQPYFTTNYIIRAV